MKKAIVCALAALVLVAAAQPSKSGRKPYWSGKGRRPPPRPA